MTVRAFLMVCVLAAVFLSSERVSAYQYDSEIEYKTSNATLKGTSWTRKEQSDWNTRRICAWWRFSFDLGLYCSVIYLQYAHASLSAEIHRQVQNVPVHSEYERDYQSAETVYETTLPSGDVWSARAEHYMEVDNYVVFCYPSFFLFPTCSPAYYVGTQVSALGTSLAQERVCGIPTVDTLVREYQNSRYGANIRPGCGDFTNSGRSRHFTWSQLNGGFRNGNPHRPWGMVTQRLKNGLDYIVSNYANFAGIWLTSGYRCPHGNADVGGVKTSYHTHGRAADLLRHGWTESEFNEMRKVARDAGGFEVSRYSDYRDHHLHVAF